MPDLPRRYRTGRSPFDDIMEVDEEGTEWWCARRMAPYLGYTTWEGIEGAIARARAACRNTSHDPDDHFRRASKMVDTGSGARRPVVDVQMDRFGCYLLAMNGDPRKPEIAAAQQYFALMTRAAEKAVAVPAAIIEAPRPWSVRFSETTADHFCYLTTHHPGFFSVVSASVAHMLMMEEELIRHLLPLKPSDLPDGSIGQHWARYRWRQGLTPATLKAPLLLPDRGINAQVLIYPAKELGDFLNWLATCYIPVHLPDYYGNKPEFRPHGELPPASAAEHTCQRITGRPSAIEPRLRRQLKAAGGFFPAGAVPPALPGEQRMLF